MGSITLAGETIPLTTPADYDQQVIAATGCCAAEIVARLGDYTLAGNLAAALRPLLPPGVLPGIALADALHGELAANRTNLFDQVRGALAPSPASMRKDA